MVKKTNEIFETDEVAEAEVAEAEAEEVEEPIVEPPKKVKKKRVLSEEQKERLREQLKKGRQTSLANRRKKKQLNDMNKEKIKEQKDEELMKHLESKKLKGNLAKENELLKLKLKEYETKRERPASPKTVKPPLETIKEEVKEEVKHEPKAPKPVILKRTSLLPNGLKLSDLYRM